MKHIKTYKLFESIRQDITEICYELTDGRFGVKIYDDSELPVTNTGIYRLHVLRVLEDGDNIICIYLSDQRDYDGFSFDEVKEVVLRLIDYLGNRYKGCSVLSVGEMTRFDINKREIDDQNWTNNLTNLIIKYK